MGVVIQVLVGIPHPKQGGDNLDAMLRCRLPDLGAVFPIVGRHHVQFAELGIGQEHMRITRCGTPRKKRFRLPHVLRILQVRAEINPALQGGGFYGPAACTEPRSQDQNSEASARRVGNP